MHVECPGKVCICDELTEEEKDELSLAHGGGKWGDDVHRHFIHPWGVGMMGDTIVDGIFMATSVKDTCQAWNLRIIADEDGNEIIGHLGDLEHLRKYLPERSGATCNVYGDYWEEQVREVIEPNQIYWMTDRTPHEALPMKESGYRQFFRLVTDNVGLWYERHSTSNPNGVVPDPKITKIIRKSKFDC